MSIDPQRLSPAEASQVRRRHIAARTLFALVLVALVGGMFAASGNGLSGLCVWLAVGVPVLGFAQWTYARAVRCPRCGSNVYGPRPADPEENYAGDASPWNRRPDRCGHCRVRLTTV